jgi:hypothetical protein
VIVGRRRRVHCKLGAVAVIKNTVWIQKSIDEVFDFIADMGNEMKWNPDRDGTRIHQPFDARPSGWFRLVFPIFVLMMRRREEGGGEREAIS